MKLKDNFVLRQVAKTWVVLPLGQGTLDFNGMLTLNESGVLLWQALVQGGDKEMLVNVLTQEYNVAHTQASEDVECFLEKLKSFDCIEN